MAIRSPLEWLTRPEKKLSVKGKLKAFHCENQSPVKRALWEQLQKHLPLPAPGSLKCTCSNATKGTARSKAPGVRNLFIRPIFSQILAADAGSCLHSGSGKEKGVRPRRPGQPRAGAGSGKATASPRPGSALSEALWRPRHCPLPPPNLSTLLETWSSPQLPARTRPLRIPAGSGPGTA